MTSFIQSLVINSFFIYGIYKLFDNGEVFGYIGKKIRKLPTWVQKPLTECPPCMASVWGTAGFIVSGLPIKYYLVYIIALAGLNFIIGNLTK